MKTSWQVNKFTILPHELEGVSLRQIDNGEPARFWRCFVLVVYGATDVEGEARTQLKKEHLPKCPTLIPLLLYITTYDILAIPNI